MQPSPVTPDRLSIYLESTQYPQKLTESLVHGFTHGFELGHFKNHPHILPNRVD